MPILGVRHTRASAQRASRSRADPIVRFVPLAQLAVPVAVGEVDHEADRHPDDQPLPVLRRQREHQQQAGQNARESARTERAARGTAARPSGLVRRMISTAAQTITNASSVPMFVSSARMRQAAGTPAMAATKTPVRMVDFHGVRNFGWTAPKKPCGTRPSRAMARKTRGWLSIITSSTEVMPASAGGDEILRPGQPDLPERVGHRRVDVDLVVGHHAGQHRRRPRCRGRADHQRRDDADRHVARRILRLLGVRGDRVEADVGEEDDRRAGQHAERLALRRRSGPRACGRRN